MVGKRDAAGGRRVFSFLLFLFFPLSSARVASPHKPAVGEVETGAEQPSEDRASPSLFPFSFLSPGLRVIVQASRERGRRRLPFVGEGRRRRFLFSFFLSPSTGRGSAARDLACRHLINFIMTIGTRKGSERLIASLFLFSFSSPFLSSGPGSPRHRGTSPDKERSRRK